MLILQITAWVRHQDTGICFRCLETRRPDMGLLIRIFSITIFRQDGTPFRPE
jgi:hypothetical protein